MFNLLDPLHDLNFEPTCDYPGCSEVAYRVHRPPCRCFVMLYCLPHTLKARLEIELSDPVAKCHVCGMAYPTRSTEQPLPRPNP